MSLGLWHPKKGLSPDCFGVSVFMGGAEPQGKELSRGPWCWRHEMALPERKASLTHGQPQRGTLLFPTPMGAQGRRRPPACASFTGDSPACDSGCQAGWAIPPSWFTERSARCRREGILPVWFVAAIRGFLSDGGDLCCPEWASLHHWKTSRSRVEGFP